MGADWSRLAVYLAAREGDVVLTWAEFDAIVGGLPRSAVDHYPQWWHGDRPNVRAWLGAGYRPVEIRPGAYVRFANAEGRAPSPTLPRPVRTRQPRPPGWQGRLSVLDPADCLLIVPCSDRKRATGRRSVAQGMHIGDDLEQARRSVLAVSNVDRSTVLPAWERYGGNFYRAAGSGVGDVAKAGRLVILSGGYGVLDGREATGAYNRLLSASDWPTGLLERTIAARTAQLGLDVVAFAGASTAYAKVLRRVVWALPPGRVAYLVTTQGLRGVSAVSGALGTAFVAFVSGTGEYPPATIIERLDR